MLTPEPTLDPGRLRRDVSTGLGFDPGSLEFVPAGEDSWAFASADIWVSVRRDLRGHNPRAYSFAAWMRRQGYPVVAPLQTVTGGHVLRSGGFPVVVFDRVPIATMSADRTEDVDAAVALLRSVHEVGLVDQELLDRRPVLPPEDYRVPFAEVLSRAAVSAAAPSSTGPFDRAVRKRLQSDASLVEAAVDRLRLLAHKAAADGAARVVTHGDASLQNFARTPEGVLLLDWGGAAVGHLDRDRVHLERTAGVPCVGPHAEYYRLRWVVSELAEYVEHFARHHDGTKDDEAMWLRFELNAEALVRLASGRGCA